MAWGVAGALLLAAAAAVVAGQYALAVLLFFAGIVLLGFGSMRRAAAARAEDPLEGLDAESRATMLRLRRLYRELERLVEGHPAAPSMRFMGKTALAEAAETLDQVARSLRLRRDLKRIAQAETTGDAGEMIAQLDAGIRDAEASLEEIKSRLAASLTADAATSFSGDDLRETIARMKALSETVDEARELLGEE